MGVDAGGGYRRSVSVNGWQSMVSVCGVVPRLGHPQAFAIGTLYWGDDGFAILCWVVILSRVVGW